MANQTPDQLGALTEITNSDLFVVYSVADSVLKKMAASVLIARMLSDIGAGTYLAISSNLSDLASASAARTNLGLGTVATHAIGDLLQTANNLSDIPSAATARTNLGAASVASPAFTGGLTLDGAQKGNPSALSGTSIDLSVAEGFTKSISADTTFTFTGATAGKVQGCLLALTVSSAAKPTFTSVKWSDGVTPLDIGNGLHLLSFLTLDGGTTILGQVLGTDYS